MATRWDGLSGDSGDWQRRLELALDRLMELQEAEDLLDGQLRQAAMVKESWEPTDESLLIASLPEHIDRVKVGQNDACFKSMRAARERQRERDTTINVLCLGYMEKLKGVRQERIIIVHFRTLST